jgi:hypothetical protein
MRVEEEYVMRVEEECVMREKKLELRGLPAGEAQLP